MIFPDLSDVDKFQTKNTPEPDMVLKNLDGFQKKWSAKKWNGNAVLNENAYNVMEKLQHHIGKGCLFGIPPHSSSSQ